MISPRLLATAGHVLEELVLGGGRGQHLVAGGGQQPVGPRLERVLGDDGVVRDGQALGRNDDVGLRSFLLGDFRPYLFRTDDYGRTWTSIAGNLPEGDFLRSVREDPSRPGLLYAATERGVWVSWDDGASWESLFEMARTLEGAVASLPEGMADAFGRRLGAAVYRLGIRRATVEHNLRLAFPDATQAWRDDVARRAYEHLGREAAAMLRLAKLDPQAVIDRTVTRGWDEMEGALAEGNGCILVTGHYDSRNSDTLNVADAAPRSTEMLPRFVRRFASSWPPFNVSEASGSTVVVWTTGGSVSGGSTRSPRTSAISSRPACWSAALPKRARICRC